MVQSCGRGPNMLQRREDFLPDKRAVIEQSRLYLFIFGATVDFPGPLCLSLYDRHAGISLYFKAQDHT